MLPAESEIVVWLEGPAQMIECLQAALGREALALQLRDAPASTIVLTLCAEDVAESVEVLAEPLGSAGDAGWLVLLSPLDDEGEGTLLATLVAVESAALRRSATLAIEPACEPPPDPSLFDLLFAEGALGVADRPEPSSPRLPPVALLDPLALLTTQSNDNWTPIVQPEPPVVRVELRELASELAADIEDESAAEPSPDPFVLGTLADLLEEGAAEGAALEYLCALPDGANRAVGRAVARFAAHPEAAVRAEVVRRALPMLGEESRPVLEGLARDRDAGVQLAALGALQQLGAIDRHVVALAGALLLDGDVARVELQCAAARVLAVATPQAKASAVRVLRQVLEPKRLSLLLVMRGPTAERRHAPAVLEQVFLALSSLEGEAARPIAKAAVLAASGERRADLREALERAESALA